MAGRIRTQGPKRSYRVILVHQQIELFDVENDGEIQSILDGERTGIRGWSELFVYKPLSETALSLPGSQGDFVDVNAARTTKAASLRALAAKRV